MQYFEVVESLTKHYNVRIISACIIVCNELHILVNSLLSYQTNYYSIIFINERTNLLLSSRVKPASI